MYRVLLLLCALLLSSCNGSSQRGTHAGADEVRSFDGGNNNLQAPEMGKAGIELLRMMDANYDDGLGSPAMSDRPNPRLISNAVFSQNHSRPSQRGLSSIVWQWGQFLDHDIDLTPEKYPEEKVSVSIPAGDPWFDPAGTGTQVMLLNRSIYSVVSGVRQQKNMISAWIDASNIYGSDPKRAAWLRTGQGGKLKMSEGGFLPFNDGSQLNAGPAPFDTRFFVSGDVRANEQLGLIAFHTLFAREHNRLADEIAAANPDFTDEQIYQRARKFVGAYVQSITFNEFLPALLGTNAPGPYQGYDDGTDPSIINEFSTALYRLGHSMIPTEFRRRDETGNAIPQGDLKLRDAFFRPDKIFETGIDPIIAGLASQTMEEIDTYVVDDLRNMLFGPPGAGGLDLVTLNITRGREHGLPDYNSLRDAFGLEPYRSFSEITSNATLAQKLEEAYGSVDKIDAWVGALAEDHEDDSSVGQLITVGLLQQFTALRACDRFWYENDAAFSTQERAEIRATTLSQIVRRNTELESLREHLFTR